MFADFHEKCGAQYIRFKFSPEETKALADSSIPAAVVIKHKNYNAEAPLNGGMRQALYSDITDGSTVNVWN